MRDPGAARTWIHPDGYEITLRPYRRATHWSGGVAKTRGFWVEADGERVGFIYTGIGPDGSEAWFRGIAPLRMGHNDAPFRTRMDAATAAVDDAIAEGRFR